MCNVHIHKQAGIYVMNIQIWTSTHRAVTSTDTTIFVVADGNNPVFLSRLNCDGTETNLTSCESFTGGIGFANCDSERAVAVRCEGM